MNPQYQIVFDLTTHPGRIHAPYGFMALSLIIGLVALVIAIMLLARRARGRKRLLVFSLVWIGFTTYMSIEQIAEAGRVRESVRDRLYPVAEGCLDDFHPGLAEGSRSVEGNERWTVAGQHFNYGAGEVGFSYHQVEPNGGAVHPDTRVRVSYVPDTFGGQEIVKLETVQHACPWAIERSAS